MTVTVLLLMVLQMWKATAGHTISVSQDDGADDWETDPDFVVWLLDFADSTGALHNVLRRSSLGGGLCISRRTL